MIIWSGLGILVPIVAFICFFVTQFATTTLSGDDRYYTEHGLPKLIAFWVAAALVFLMGRLLTERGTRVLVDPQTGEQVLLKPGHSLFFIPVVYWGPILFALGIVFLFV